MKKLVKGLLVVLCGFLILCGAIVLLINLYLQSEGVRARIQNSLGEAFDVPIEIRTISFTPPGGLKLSGIAVPTDRENDPEFLRSSNVTVRFRLSPLFRNRFIIQEIVVHEPAIYWAQSERGKWRPPSDAFAVASEATPPPAEPAPTPVEPPLEPSPGPVPVEAPSEVAPPAPARGPRFEVQVKQFAIQNGTVELREKDGDPVVSLTGINVRGEMSLKDIATGTATSQRTRIADRVLLEMLTTDFKVSEQELELRNVEAKFGGGTFIGSFTTEFRMEDSPFKLHAQFSDVDLPKLLEEAGGPAAKVEGRLSGSLRMRGSLRSRENAVGEGHLILTGGSLAQFGLLQLIGDNLRIAELSKLDLQKASANFHIGDGKVTVDKLLLKSQNLEISAHGKIKLDGGLNLEARLTINESIGRQLPDFIEQNFTPIADTKTRFVDFQIGGTLDNPETDLMRLVLWKRHEEAAVSLIRKLFGGGEKKEKGKKESKED